MAIKEINSFETVELVEFSGNFFCEYSFKRGDGSNRHEWVTASAVRRICHNCHRTIVKVDDPDGFNWNTELYVIKEMP